MSTQQSFQMNPGTDAIFRYMRAGLDADIIGTTNTSILFFSGPGEGSPLIPISGAAAEGTRFSIQQTGLYSVKVRLQNAGPAVVAGVSMNTDNAGLTALPSYDVLGMADLQFVNGVDGLGQAPPLNLDALVKVTAEMLAVDPIGANVRIHARSQANGDPTGLVTVNASVIIRRISLVF